jgi:stage III sporulation protein AE
MGGNHHSTMLLICFTGYLTVSGAIAGTADAVTIKAAKFAMSGASGGGGHHIGRRGNGIGGRRVLRNTVGVFGMLTILAICIIPFLRLGAQYLMYNSPPPWPAPWRRPGGTAHRRDRGAFGLVLGMTGACALILLISIVSSVKAVTG